jgi:hypothetical protein
MDLNQLLWYLISITFQQEALFYSVKFFNEKGPKYDRERHEMERMLHKKIKNRAE